MPTAGADGGCRRIRLPAPSPHPAERHRARIRAIGEPAGATRRLSVATTTSLLPDSHDPEVAASPTGASGGPADAAPHLAAASPPRAGLILFALWLMVFTAASQTILITPILPIIGEELGMGPGPLGWLVSLYSWVLAAAAVVMGPVSDRIGRRRVLLLGSGWLAAALALHGLADSYGMLLAARVLAGAGGGMLSGAAVSYVGDAFPYARRGWATGWVMSGVPFGLVLGVPMGRMLAVASGYKLPFLVFAGVMAAAFVLILTVVPQPDIERSETLTLRGALRQYGALLRLRDAQVASLLYFLMYLSLGLLLFYLPYWLTEQFPDLTVRVFGEPLVLLGLPVDFIASLFLVGGVASVLVSPRAGALSDTIGRKPLILASCVGLVVVSVAMTYVVRERWSAYAVYLAIMTLFAMRMSPLQALMTAIVPERVRGSFLSMAIAVGQVGTGIGATLAGALYEGAGYRAATFASGAVVLAMTVLVWLALPEPEGDAVEAA